MFRRRKIGRLSGWLLTLVGSLSFAQAPTGSISGTVYDESGSVIPSATLELTNKATGTHRTAASGSDGTFNFPSLQAGTYELRTESSGFRTLLRDATVETGGVSRVEMRMQVGASKEIVTVEAVAPQIAYESHAVEGVVSRQYIDSLPLNGRSFLQLASIEPGVTVSAGALGQYNRQFDVNILGSGSETVRITVDGATVNDSVTGGTQQNFSQDIVEEFQVSIANFDLSTGITGSGAVNVVTRGGGNDFHGSGYYYYRDHNISAYPYLQRDPLHPDPFFQRQQPGFQVGGPILKNKLFFFGSYEHSKQTALYSTLPSDPEFAAFATNYPSPYHGNLVGGRVDYHINDKHTAFLRYSHDGNNAFSPSGGGTQPSNWAVNKNYADSAVMSLVSSLSPALVNEFRYSFTYWDNTKNPPTAAVCPNCIGLSGPQYNIYGIDNFQIGNDASNTPQSRNLKRHIFADNFTWQRSAHRFKMGGEWEYQQGTGTYAYAEPGGVTLFSPSIVRYYNSQVPDALQLPLPASFTTLQDILQLPVAGFATGVGDINQPPSYNRGSADHNNRFHFYGQDTWKIRPNLTINYGLAWSYESDLLNYDLTKPAYLAPLVGTNGLGKEKHNPTNFTPMLGFSWSPGHDNKTVIRGGGGIYYDTMNIEVRLLERASIGPLGTGRVLLYDSAFLPSLYNIAFPPALQPYLPPLNSLSDRPTYLTGALLQGLLPTLRAGVAQQLHQNPNNTDLSIRNINVFKTSPGLDLFDRNFQLPYSEHASVGVQRQITSDMALTADFVFRQFLHERIRNTDFNHYDSVGGPVIPKCVGAQALDPLAECSTGRIDFNVSGARSHYKGLLVKLDKRFSRRYLFTASYALQSRVGYNGLIDESNWNASYGPQQGHHLFNFAGVIDLPWGFQVSVISSYQSQGPFQPSISGIDLNGNGDNGVPLPGGGYNQFGVNKGKGDLVKLVAAFNQNYAGKTTPRGQSIPTITLPARYQLGQSFHSQDLRLTKDFKICPNERCKISLFGEVFNVLNIANLGGYSGDLTNGGFGQATSRASNIFGSGGPRAFQLGGKFSF